MLALRLAAIAVCPAVADQESKSFESDIGQRCKDKPIHPTMEVLLDNDNLQLYKTARARKTLTTAQRKWRDGVILGQTKFRICSRLGSKPLLWPFRALSKSVLNVSWNTRTREILFKLSEKRNDRLTCYLSAVCYADRKRSSLLAVYHLCICKTF